MMLSKNSSGQIIKAGVAGGTPIVLPCAFRVIKAVLDDLCGRPRWTLDPFWPAQLASGLITLHISDEILDIDLQCWTPVRGWDREGHQCTPSAHATTLESNISLPTYASCVERPSSRFFRTGLLVSAVAV